MFCVFCFALLLFFPIDRSSILTGKFPVVTPKMASLKNSRIDPFISVPREAEAGDTFYEPAEHPPFPYNLSSETYAPYVDFLMFTPLLVLRRKRLPYWNWFCSEGAQGKTISRPVEVKATQQRDHCTASVGFGDQEDVYKNKLLKRGQPKALLTWRSKRKVLVWPEK